MRKVHIQRFSTGSIIIAAILAILVTVASIWGIQTFRELESTTTQYLTCEKSAQKLQEGSDTLTEQVRLFVMTGQTKYLDGYFTEANVTKNREKAIKELNKYFAGTHLLDNLEKALDQSQFLMESEIYAMKLAADAFQIDDNALPAELTSITLTSEDLRLDTPDKLKKARTMVSDNNYENLKTQITDNVNLCMNELVDLTHSRQEKASAVFERLYWAQELGCFLLLLFLLINSAMIRKLIVRPLICYNKHIAKDELIPPSGATELQALAETYNNVFQENLETQKLIRHEAEHDALTDLLNRGSFDKLLLLYHKGQMPFALILADIDDFKSFNDTYGHAVGDEVIKRVAYQLKSSFRSTDYIFRIGGDEFAIIMVEVPSSLKPTVKEKLCILKENLLQTENSLPPVTLSIGVAFSDQETPAQTLFEAADEALYYTKNHGKNGGSFYDSFVEEPTH